MPRKISSLFILAFALLVTAVVTHAQQTTFVSGEGSDANPCTRGAPCLTFQRGHDMVAAGGEVVALDSAGYGALSITKSVTISGEGIRAALTAGAGQNGITINAVGATVILRELTVTGLAGSGDGVFVQNAATVYIERCVITGFVDDGIDYETNTRLFITDTTSRSNGGDGLDVTAPTGGTARINIDRSRFVRNGRYGILMDDSVIEASISNSIMSENGLVGFLLFTGGATPSRAQISHSTAANNGTDGFVVSRNDELNIEYSVARGNVGVGMGVGSGTIRVSNSVSTNNLRGFENGGGTFESRGNNTVAGNTNPNAGVITTIGGQ